MSSGIRLSGDFRKLVRKLKKLSDVDYRGINMALGETLRTSTIQRFKDEEDPEGKPWIPSIRAQEENGKTLTKSGRLRRSIKTKADSSGFAVGTNRISARTHQLGDEGRVIRARKAKGLRFRVGGKWFTKKKVIVTIPARPYLGISDDDMRNIVEMLEGVMESG